MTIRLQIMLRQVGINDRHNEFSCVVIVTATEHTNLYTKPYHWPLHKTLQGSVALNSTPHTNGRCRFQI